MIMKKSFVNAYVKPFAVTIVLLGVIIAGVFANSKKNASYTENLIAMDTTMTLTEYGTDTISSAMRECLREIVLEDNLLSVTNPNSEIYKLNRAKEKFSVEKNVFDLIEKSVKTCDMTGKNLDISIYPLVRAWGFTTEDYRVLEEAFIDDLLRFVDCDGIKLDRNGYYVTLPDNAEIDLGAVAKGNLGNVLRDILESHGVKSANLNLGGNVVLIGAKPDGSKFNIAVVNPDNVNGFIGILNVSDTSVVTSGAYERFFEDDNGNVYGHIINPKTGYPAASGYKSVTVVCKDSFLADAYSTALYVMGPADAEKFYRQNSDFEFIGVSDDSLIYVSEGLKDVFLPGEDMADKIVYVERY